jgi:hypothetical protein
MASTYLRRTSFGTPTEAKKFTISFWFKRTGLGSKYLMGCYDGSSTNSNDFVFSSGDALSMYFGGNAGSGYLLQPNRLFRDTNAWYHLVDKAVYPLGTSYSKIPFPLALVPALDTAVVPK